MDSETLSLSVVFHAAHLRAAPSHIRMFFVLCALHHRMKLIDGNKLFFIDLRNNLICYHVIETLPFNQIDIRGSFQRHIRCDVPIKLLNRFALQER